MCVNICMSVCVCVCGCTSFLVSYTQHARALVACVFVWHFSVCGVFVWHFSVCVCVCVSLCEWSFSNGENMNLSGWTETASSLLFFNRHMPVCVCKYTQLCINTYVRQCEPNATIQACINSQIK